MAMSPRLLRPRATGFTPRSLSGLAAWYDAADSSTIAIETGVSQWADKSGNGRNLTQSTNGTNVANNQPAYNSVQLNGKATVTFDGVNDSLRTATTSIPQPYHVFAIWRFESTYTAARRVLEARTAGGARSGELFSTSSTNVSLFSGGTGAGQLGVTLSSGQREQFGIYDYEANAASSRLRYRKADKAASGTIGNNASNGFTLGANGNATPGEWGDVSIAEVICYGRALTESEADRIRDYLAAKWGLTYQK